MTIITSTINYLDDTTPLEAFIAYDDSISKKMPTVLVSHAWGGRDQFVADKAIAMAKMGYLGFALDMYGKNVCGNSIAENSKLMQPFLDDRILLQKRILAAYLVAKVLPWADANKIAAIGFCFGGMCVLDLARSGVAIKGVVSFHGLLDPPKNIPTKTIKAKILLLHGHDDPMATILQVQALQNELTVAKVDWQLHNYGQTLHAFSNPLANDPHFGAVYQPLAATRSWASMKHFLAEIFL